MNYLKGILLVLIFTNCTKVKKNDLEITEYLQGRWVLSSDEKFEMRISSNSVKELYNGELQNNFKVQFSYGDSINFYVAKNGGYNFLKNDGTIYQGLMFSGLDIDNNDSISIKVVYIDSLGMDLISGNSTGSFRKVSSLSQTSQ
jgi:hypothetical protein